MGNSTSSFPKFDATIKTKDEEIFRFSYSDLIDHVLLLRKVISDPEMVQEGSTLNYFIDDYCKRMAQEGMLNKKQQVKLPWQVEWIWHVHRLHPLDYYNDCKKQLRDGKIVDKLVYNSIKNNGKKPNSKVAFISKNSGLSFVPSINLAKAVVRQRDFLDKFRKHDLYLRIFNQKDRSHFEHLVQNYVSFIKLARKNEMIVPTFDIDLIWHTHMRCPLHYRRVSKSLCGFILDHDDSIEQNILSNNYRKTADQWKKTYNTDYGKNIQRKNVQTPKYISSCASVIVPFIGSNCGGGGSASCGAVEGGCQSICGGGGCGGGCGGDCGGD